MNYLHSFRYDIAGTTMFWVAMETHPELNEKIELMVLFNYYSRVNFYI
jgi:hypothetical protein